MNNKPIQEHEDFDFIDEQIREEEGIPIIKKQQTSPVDTNGKMLDQLGNNLMNKFFDREY